MKIISTVILFLFASLLFLNSCQNKSKQPPRIVIIQDKPQEWADALKLGFTEGLIELGLDVGKDVIIISRSGSGDQMTFTNIAQTISKSDYQIIYTLGTQSSQELLNLTKEKNIIFGAVTDPIKAGLFKNNLQTPLGNITGSQDLWPYSAQFDLIKQLLPNIKKIGVIYSSSEINSQVSIDFIKIECKKRNIILEEKTVINESEVITAVNALINQKIDLLFIPADNTAQTSSSVILNACQNKIPVFTGISGIVENGAIATVGTNYFELGKVNAKQAFQIIKNNKLAKEIPVAIAEKGDIYINLKVAKQLGIPIPEEIIKTAFKIYN
jgi:putative tryptophan/tyrosine transport system substrate-binding protein